jgi:hypothetical protein
MRSIAMALLVGLCGCNQILEVGDPPARCAGGCACNSDEECGLNQLCNNHDTSSTCECAAGFQLTAAGCEWQGIVVDPGFAQASTWTVMNDAALDVSAATQGMRDVGVARLDAASCSAAFTQQVSMPRYSSKITPLVAEITYLMTGSVAPTFGIGTVWSTVPDADRPGWNTARVCLGSGQYADGKSSGVGEKVMLTIGRTVNSSCLAGGPSVDIDHFEIVPAHLGECPVPGEVLNGLAEATGGWVFTPSTPSATLSAGFVSGAGENGSRGVQVLAMNSCGPAKAVVPLSPAVSDATGSPALSLYVSTMPVVSTGPSDFTGSLDRSQIPMPGVQQASTMRVCVPAPQRGSSNLLGITMSSANCALNATATIDTVHLENDPLCGTDPALADPSFESGYPLLDTSTPEITTTIHSVVPADRLAHQGTRVLEMTAGSCTANASIRLHVLTPSLEASKGPGLTFWYRSTNGGNSPLTVASYETMTLPMSTPEWQPALLCLDSKLAGRGQDVIISLQPGSCANMLPAVAQIDDLAAITTAKCPAK